MPDLRWEVVLQDVTRTMLTSPEIIVSPKLTELPVHSFGRPRKSRRRARMLFAEHCASKSGLYVMQPASSPVVLIVDDEALVRLTAADILTDWGATVLEASDADEALEILSQRDDIALVFPMSTCPGKSTGCSCWSKFTRFARRLS